jgi:cell division transport system permease protein
VRWSLVGFVLRRVHNSLRQLLWSHLLTAGIMAMTLFVFGAFMLLETNLQKLLRGWGDQIQITAYLGNDLTAGDVGVLLQRVQVMPEVERVRYTSQEQAWRDFQAALGTQSGLLDGLPREVLPASIDISLRPSHRDGPALEQLAMRLKTENGVASVEYPQEWIERLGLIVLVLEWIKWILAGILFFATFFIVGSTSKLAIVARQDEVEIMQLIGASEELIQAPFVVEGMIQGLAGGVVAIAGLGITYGLLQAEVARMGGLFAPMDELRFLNLTSLGLLLGTGWLLGAVGSLVSLRRFLRTWHASSARA